MEKIIHGDCLDVLKELPDKSVDAVVTDPPYGLSKEPDIREVLTKWMNGEDYHHRGGGFMGKTWDSFVPGPSIWKEVYRVLKPGGHVLCFAGTRTQDLMTISLRLAGFEIRDVIEWLYFSGFPKSLDVGKQFDKKNGSALAFREEAERFAAYLKERREAKGLSKSEIDRMLGLNTSYSWWEGRKSGVQPPSKENYLRLKPILDLDDRFDEFIERVEAEREVIGLKRSGDGKTFASRQPNGWVNAGFIDAGKTLNTQVYETAPATELAKKWDGWGSALKPAHEPIILARKPLEGTICDNVEKWGTGALNIDGCRIADDEFKPKERLGATKLMDVRPWNEQQAKEGRPITIEGNEKGRFPANCITTEPDMFYSKYFNITPPELSKKASKKDRLSTWDGRQVEANKHPTVKPVELMAWLIRLITPPGGIVLDPFAGSGSTLVAAKREGFSFIGIEKEAEYIEIAKARVGA